MKERLLGRVALAGALAVGGLGAQAAATNEADGATVVSYNCSKTTDKWVPLGDGVITVIKASDVVVPADKTVNGEKQTDDLKDTATVLGLTTKDNTNKNWVFGTDYTGSAFILKCGSSNSRFNAALGREVARADVKLGVNIASKSVQAQIIKQ